MHIHKNEWKNNFINKLVYLKEYVTICYSKQRNQTLKLYISTCQKTLQVVNLHPLSVTLQKLWWKKVFEFNTVSYRNK